MKPKTEPYYKQVKKLQLHCPHCNKEIWGDGSLNTPYECGCGKWNCHLENNNFNWILTKKYV